MGNLWSDPRNETWSGGAPILSWENADPTGLDVGETSTNGSSIAGWLMERLERDPCFPGLTSPFGDTNNTHNGSGFTAVDFRQANAIFGNADGDNDSWHIPKGPCDPTSARPGWNEQTGVGKGPEADAFFEPPPSGLCEPHKDAAFCRVPPVDPRDCDLSQLPVDEVEGLFNLVVALSLDPVDPDWLDLIYQAWALLFDNLDIIEWIACVITGETVDSGHKDVFGAAWDFLTLGTYKTLAECLTDAIVGRQPQVTIKLQDKNILNSGFNTLRFVSGGKIRIRTGTIEWMDNYVIPYKEAKDGSCAKFCIVADLAATLLHELVHTCGTDTVLPDTHGDCRNSYLMENCFRWALGRRYPNLVSFFVGVDPSNSIGPSYLSKARRQYDTFCWFYSDDCLWLNDEVTWPNQPPIGCG